MRHDCKEDVIIDELGVGKGYQLSDCSRLGVQVVVRGGKSTTKWIESGRLLSLVAHDEVGEFERFPNESALRVQEL